MGKAPAAELAAAPPLAAQSRVELRALSIRQEGESFLVGDIARGEFIEVPAIAVTLIEALQDGSTLAEVTSLAQARAGADVDVTDFVQTLRDLGFVRKIDGVPLSGGGPELTDGGRIGAVAARLARPLYSAPAWALYGALFVGCLVLMTAEPWFRPHYGQLFFLSNPVLSIALLIVIATPIMTLHELAHWLGARVEGIPARVTVSRRYYLAVLQTDLSGLWALPRRRRFGPLLAGLACDTVVIAVFLAARAAQFEGWWHPQPTVARLLATLVLWQALVISLQFILFLRTDLYAVLITGLGCTDLSHVSRLLLTRRYRRLSETEERELAAANPRDRSVARWYSWVQLTGAVIALFYFVAFFAPATIRLIRWLVDGLTRSSPGTPGFWAVFVSGCVALLPVAIPPVTYLRGLRRRPR